MVNDYEKALKAVREAIVFNIYGPDTLAEEILALPEIGVIDGGPQVESFREAFEYGCTVDDKYNKLLDKGWRKLVEKGGK